MINQYNEDLIRVKLKELRSIGLNLSQQKLLSEVENLLDDRPRPIFVPGDPEDMRLKK